MMNRILLAFAGTATLVVISACNTSSSDDDERPLVFEGVYVANGGATITFEHDRYVDVPEGCEAPDCEERGAFAVDRKAHELRFVVDGTGRSYAKPYELVQTLPASGAVTPRDLAGGGGQLIDQRGAGLVVTNMKLVDRDYALLQDVPDCSHRFGLGTGRGDDSEFPWEFYKATNRKILPRFFPGCPNRAPGECTTFDKHFPNWIENGGTEASCASGCAQAGGFNETAKATMRQLGGVCAVERPPGSGDDSLDLRRATLVTNPGRITEAGCYCSVSIQYRPN